MEQKRKQSLRCSLGKSRKSCQFCNCAKNQSCPNCAFVVCFRCFTCKSERIPKIVTFKVMLFSLKMFNITQYIMRNDPLQEISLLCQWKTLTRTFYHVIHIPLVPLSAILAEIDSQSYLSFAHSLCSYFFPSSLT